MTDLQEFLLLAKRGNTMTDIFNYSSFCLFVRRHYESHHIFKVYLVFTSFPPGKGRAVLFSTYQTCVQAFKVALHELLKNFKKERKK